MRKSDNIILRLQELMLEQHLQVGDRLPAERKLCELLEVSRSSLREAIRTLNTQGILETRIGNGSFILQLPIAPSNHSSDDLNQHNLEYQIVSPQINELINLDPSYRFDVQEARLALEAGTTWLAAERATEQDKQKIRYYYEQISKYQALGDNEQAASCDAQFHLAIAEASHNLVLIQMMRELFDLLQFNIVLGRRKIYSHPSRFDQLHQQHYDIMTAIERSDPVSARKIVIEHINFVVQQVRNIDEDEARLRRVHRLLEV